jgi:hypothetical protein
VSALLNFLTLISNALRRSLARRTPILASRCFLRRLCNSVSFSLFGLPLHEIENLKIARLLISAVRFELTESLIALLLYESLGLGSVRFLFEFLVEFSHACSSQLGHRKTLHEALVLTFPESSSVLVSAKLGAHLGIGCFGSIIIASVLLLVKDLHVLAHGGGTSGVDLVFEFS